MKGYAATVEAFQTKSAVNSMALYFGDGAKVETKFEGGVWVPAVSMKEKLARKNQSKVEIKEMKFRPKVDKHDYETKKKHVLRFLAANAKVKVTIMFRGREMAHPELGLNILERLAGELGEDAIIETQPKIEGRNMHMLLAPVKKKEVKESATSEETGAAGDEPAAGTD